MDSEKFDASPRRSGTGSLGRRRPLLRSVVLYTKPKAQVLLRFASSLFEIEGEVWLPHAVRSGRKFGVRFILTQARHAVETPNGMPRHAPLLVEHALDHRVSSMA